MKLSEIPTSELRRILAATERAVGADAHQVRAMQRELQRRAQNGAGTNSSAVDHPIALFAQLKKAHESGDKETVAEMATKLRAVGIHVVFDSQNNPTVEVKDVR